MPTSLDCPDIAIWPRLLADTLPPDRRAAWERHLEACPKCQEHLDRTTDRDAALLTLARQMGDPTTAPVDATLGEVLSRLRKRGASLAGEPVDLYFLRPSDRPDLLGLLGEYEVTEVIGQGGMGTVLKAFDPSLRRWVAIKVMAAAIAGSATARKRFTREAHAAAAVSHENLVSVYSVHETDGLPYFVMQYVAGESLQDRLEGNGPLGVNEILAIGLQAARGLAAAHAQKLIHRDIKPANLLLETSEQECGASQEIVAPSTRPFLPRPRVKIADFGLARTTDDTQLTQNGVVTGTPEYMSPEQARGEPVDHRADLFSLGSVLFAMCTGHAPFSGPSTVAVLRQVSDLTPTPIRSLNPDIPEWLESIADRLLAKNPADRYQSAAEVAAVFEAYLAHLRQPDSVKAPAPPDRKNPNRRWLSWKVAASLIVAALLVSLAGFLSVGKQDEQQRPAALRNVNLWAEPNAEAKNGKSLEPAHDLVCFLVNKNSGRCLSVGDGAGNPGARVVQGPTPDKAAAAERWRLLKAGKAFRLQNEASKLVLEIGSANMNPGVQAIHWRDHVTRTNQHWTFEKLEDGYVVHVGHNDFVLCIQEGSQAAGGAAIQWDFLPGEHDDQRWELLPAFHEYTWSFKGNAEPRADFELIGPSAAECVKFEAAGLRITLPLGYPDKRLSTGVAKNLSLKGDFEIIAGFEILSEPAPVEAGLGTGLFLGVDLDTERNRATFTRGVRDRTTLTSWFELTQKDADKPYKSELKSLPTAARVGQLRLTRIGTKLFAEFAAPGGDFALIHEHPFSGEDVKQIRIAGDTGGPMASLDVRFTDLRVRAAKPFVVRGPDGKIVVTSRDADGDAAPEARKRGWLVAVALVGLLLVGALGLAIGVWLIARRRTADKTAPGNAAQESLPSKADVGMIAFACGECGKKLRIKVESAGKKIKCPKCGKSVLAPQKEDE